MIHNEPTHTTVYEDSDDFQPKSDSIYIARMGLELRSHHAQVLLKKNLTFINIIDESKTDFSFIVGDNSTISCKCSLRSHKQLESIWNQNNKSHIYLDITGIRHHVWIPLLKSALALNREISVVYVEPKDYRANMKPIDGEIYDLSEKILGVSPLPGFATLSRTGDDFFFIMLLGFEGTRASYLLEQIQPIGDKIIPVIGVPGYQPEYPFATYFGNKLPLSQSDSWQRVKFADANCPYTIYYLLNKLAKKNHNSYLKIAPIGTKPQTLGAVLFAIQNMSRCELVYDHPIRKVERTFGKSRLLVYEVSLFLI